MISRKYKITFDLSNCIMIYLLCLGASLGITALLGMGAFAWPYAIGSAIILIAFVCMRLYIKALPVSIVAHAIVLVVCWYLPFGNENKFMLLGFAALLAVIDINDFYKKKNQSYGVIHFLACSLFLPVYAYVYWKSGSMLDQGKTDLSATYGIFSTVVCVLCIAFFALTLIRAYVANAIKLADNSQIDENAPVTYMYGNSNRFIGPIIALIIAIMLVVQVATEANILGGLWLGLLKGVAGVCNLFTFLNSDSTISDTGIAEVGTSLYTIEVIISGIILVVILALIIFIVSKIYKSHWHKDVSSDETLESAAMVERREWIYHKESSRKSAEDTSVTKAAEIPTEEKAAAEDDQEQEKAE